LTLVHLKYILRLLVATLNLFNVRYAILTPLQPTYNARAACLPLKFIQVLIDSVCITALF